MYQGPEGLKPQSTLIPIGSTLILIHVVTK
jgi:hypothetical protein